KAAGGQLPNTEAIDPRSRQPVQHEVTNVWIAGMASRLTTVVLEDHTRIRCTPEHRFLTAAGEWIAAEQLHSGLTLRAIGDGSAAGASCALRTTTILAVRHVHTESLDEAVPVFDIEVGDVHNFLVAAADQSGVVVHN